MNITLRKAGPGDGKTLHAMVKALAVHHGYVEEFKAHPQDFEAALSVPGSVVAAIIAEADGVPAGCAIFHRSFSTFRGRETMYLEDLSVLPHFHRKGIAKALMKGVAQEAVHRGVPSVSWLMMGWNEAARSLYEGLGAEVEGENCFCRLHGDALKRLAA